MKSPPTSGARTSKKAAWISRVRKVSALSVGVRPDRKAAFLLRSDGTVPPLVTSESIPALAAKSDRLPLEQWSAEASERLGAQQDARTAAATIAEDAKFLQPMMIRGSLEDGTITTFTDTASNENAMAEMPVAIESSAAPAKPRAKKHARRAPPHSRGRSPADT